MKVTIRSTTRLGALTSAILVFFSFEIGDQCLLSRSNQNRKYAHAAISLLVANLWQEKQNALLQLSIIFGETLSNLPVEKHSHTQQDC